MRSDLDKQTSSNRNEDAHIKTTSGQSIVWTSCKYTVLSENTMLSKKKGENYSVSTSAFKTKR